MKYRISMRKKSEHINKVRYNINGEETYHPSGSVYL